MPASGWRRRTGTSWSANGRDRLGALGARVVLDGHAVLADRQPFIRDRHAVVGDGPVDDRDGLGVMVDRLAVVIATAGGVGFVPLASGTAASAVTAGLLWVAALPVSGRVVALLVVITVGTWAAHRAEAVLGGKDPGAIVVDEVAGMTLTVATVPLTPEWLTIGFILFRIFDVVKPPPARWCERLPGGLGVMADDLVAGAYGLIVLAVGRAAMGG